MKKLSLTLAALAASAALVLGGALPAEAASATYTKSCATGRAAIKITPLGSGQIVVNVYRAATGNPISSNAVYAGKALRWITSGTKYGRFAVSGSAWSYQLACI